MVGRLEAIDSLDYKKKIFETAPASWPDTLKDCDTNREIKQFSYLSSFTDN